MGGRKHPFIGTCKGRPNPFRSHVVNDGLLGQDLLITIHQALASTRKEMSMLRLQRHLFGSSVPMSGVLSESSWLQTRFCIFSVDYISANAEVVGIAGTVALLASVILQYTTALRSACS